MPPHRLPQPATYRPAGSAAWERRGLLEWGRGAWGDRGGARRGGASGGAEMPGDDDKWRLLQMLLPGSPKVDRHRTCMHRHRHRHRYTHTQAHTTHQNTHHTPKHTKTHQNTPKHTKTRTRKVDVVFVGPECSPHPTRAIGARLCLTAYAAVYHDFVETGGYPRASFGTL
jgi:hypothetical protein